MGNRLLDGFSGWQGGTASGTKQSQAPANNRLVSDFEEWKKKRKPTVDANNVPPVQAPMSEPEPVTPKPVDQVEHELSLKEHAKNTGLTFLMAGEAGISRIGTAIKSWGQNNINADPNAKQTILEKVVDPNNLKSKALQTDFGKSVYTKLGELQVKLGGSIEKTYGDVADKILADPNYHADLSTFRGEDGRLSPEKFKNPIVYLNTIANGVGSFVPGATVGIVTKSPLAAGATMGLMEKGDAVSTYAEKMAKDKGVPIDQLAPEDLRKIDEISDYYGIASTVLESAFPGLLKNIIKGGGKNVIYDVLKSIPYEGGTEGIQRFTQNLLAKVSGIDKNQELTEGVVDETIAGALTGVAITAPISIGSHFSGDINQDIVPTNDTTPPKGGTPQEGEKETKKPSEGAIGFLTALHDNNEEALTAAKDTVSKADLETALNVLTQAKEQASPDQTPFIEEDIQTVQTLIQEKDGRVKEAVGKTLVEGTSELNALPPADRQDAVDTLKQVAETDHETAAKAQEILDKVEETNKKVDQTTEELRATKEELLTEKKNSEDRAVKKSVQDKIDAVDERRRAVEAIKNTPADNDKVILVEDGEFYYDEHREQVVQAVGGNVEHLAKKDYWNAGFVNTKTVGETKDYISYANQMRPATPEEVAQAHANTDKTALVHEASEYGVKISLENIGKANNDIDAQVRFLNDKPEEALKKLGYAKGQRSGGNADFVSRRLLEIKSLLNKNVAPKEEAKKEKEEKKPEKKEKKTVEKKEAPKKAVSQKKAAKTLKPISAVEAALKIITKKSSFPILQEFRVRNGYLEATNLEIGVRVKTELADGMYKVIGKDAVKTESNPEDFPDIPKVEGKTVLTISTAEFSDILKKAVLATSDNEVRLGLTSVFLGKNSLASTDSFRLFMQKMETSDEELMIGQPGKLQKVLPALGETLEIVSNGKEISIKGSTGEAVVKNITGRYPEFQRIIPSYITRLSFNKKEIVEAIKEIAPYVKEADKWITTQFFPETEKLAITVISAEKNIRKQVSVSAKRETVKTKAETVENGTLVMPIVEEASEDENAFNLEYIKDAVNTVDGDTVFLYQAENPKRTPNFFTGEELAQDKGEEPKPPKKTGASRVPKEPVVATSEIDENASETQKELARIVAEKQANKEYKDTGKKFFGAKKDMAAMRRITAENLVSLEENADIAGKYVTKDKVLAGTTFEIDTNGDPAVEFTKWKMFKAIPSKPENTPEARKFYVEEIPKYVDALKNAKTRQEILDLGYDLMNYPRPNSGLSDEARKAMIGEYRVRSRYFRKGFFDTLARQNKVGREAFSSYYAPKDFSFLEAKKREVGERKEAPKHAVLENIIREGGADLGDITPEMVKNDFGHRGIEYGNYVKDEEAKVHLRRYAESMADLEQILGIDIGEFNRAHGLGIAFGSRGTGRALAHYEPAGKVINLTKTKGDGTVAHEWGHYLDNMIFRDLFPDKPLTNDSYASHVYGSGLGNKAIGEARDALIKAMQTGVGSTTVTPGERTFQSTTWRVVDEALARAKKETPQEIFNSLIKTYRFSDHKQLAEYILVRMKGKSIEVENTRSQFISRSTVQGDYWIRKTELFARTFEGYIKDKGLKMGITNNYLTNTPDHVLWIPEEERPHIYAAMENYLDVVKKEMKFAPAPVRGKALSGVSVENTETGSVEIKGKNALVEEAKENVAIAEFINTVAKDRSTRNESGRFTGSIAEEVKDETTTHKYGSPLIIKDKDRGVQKMKDALAEQFNDKAISFKEFQQLSVLVDRLKPAIDDSILAFSDEGNTYVNGYYSFNDKLARIFKNASEDQGGVPRTVTHEIWHAASRYLSDRDLNILNREFIAQRKAFFTSGEFDKLMTELKDNESLDDTHTHLAVLNAKTPEEKIKLLGTNGRAYRFTNLDEYFAESMTDLTYDEFKAETKLTDASPMAKVVLMLKRILRAFMEAVASTETNDSLQKIFKSFWEGQNRQFNFRRGLQREFKGMETPIVFSEKSVSSEKPLINDGKIDVLELYKKVYEQIHETKAPPMSSLPDEKLVRSTTKQAFTLGKRYGKKVTKENFIAVNREIRDYIVKNIPTNDRGELLRAVINAKNKADTEKLIAKVDEMVEKGRGKQMTQEKKNLMTTVYTTLQKRGMVRGRTNEVDSGMLVQLVQEISRDNRTKMKNLTVPELQKLLELAKTLKQDNKGKIRLLSKSKVDRLTDLLPENLIGKSIITMGDLEESMNNKDITGGWLGKMDKNLFRAGRLVMIKNEITKKMYDKFSLAERNFADQMEAFNLDIKEKYRKATGQKTAFRNSKVDKKIIGYLEGITPVSELNEEQKALANDIVNFYAESLDVMKPNRLRKYYFTHTRQGFLEKVQEGGFQNAIKTFFTEEFVTDMMKDLPDEIAANLEFIVANNVFNPFGQPRKGGAYSKDLRKGLQTYARVYFQKKNFDKLFNQSNAVLTVLPPNMAKFFRRYVQSAKGRPEGIPYNPLLKSVIEKAITWEYIKLLGLNLASGLFNVVVGTVDNVATQGIFGKEGLIKGNARYMTPKGFRVIHKYRIASQDVTYEMTQLMHTVPEVANRIMFFHLAGGEHWLRGTVFLSLLTKEEWQSETLSDARWNEIRHKLGESQPLFGKFDSPVYVRHALGKTMLMFLTWLPTRVENWINWGVGAVDTLKNAEGIQNKTIENKDLIKLLRWGATFYVFSLLFGDRERWRQQVEGYKDLFNIDYWINLANPTTKPIYKDLINFWAMMKYMYTQEEYTRRGADYERGDLKWQIYAKRVITPTFVKRGLDDVSKGWESTEPEE